MLYFKDLKNGNCFQKITNNIIEDNTIYKKIWNNKFLNTAIRKVQGVGYQCENNKLKCIHIEPNQRVKIIK